MLDRDKIISLRNRFFKCKETLHYFATRGHNLIESQTLARLQDHAIKIERELAKLPLYGWTAPDGGKVHKIVQGIVESTLDNDNKGIAVESERSAIKLDENDQAVGRARIDTHIETKRTIYIVEYKTHQANEWSTTVAASRAEEFAEQVLQYVRDENRTATKPVKGLLMMLGQPPDLEEAKTTFIATAKQLGVTASFTKSGDPHRIAAELRKKLK